MNAKQQLVEVGCNPGPSGPAGEGEVNTGSTAQPLSCEQCHAQVWQDGEVLYDAFTYHVHDCNSTSEGS